MNLPLQTLSDVAQAWKSGALSNMTSSVRKSGAKTWAKNVGAALAANRPATITGFSASLSYDKAVQKMIDGTLALAVTSASSGDSVDVVTETPIATGKFGNVTGRVEFGVVSFNNQEDEYANADFSSTASGGVYRIAAKSGFDGSNAVCALIPISGGGTSTISVYVENTTTLVIEIS